MNVSGEAQSVQGRSQTERRAAAFQQSQSEFIQRLGRELQRGVLFFWAVQCCVIEIVEAALNAVVGIASFIVVMPLDAMFWLLPIFGIVVAVAHCLGVTPVECPATFGAHAVVVLNFALGSKMQLPPFDAGEVRCRANHLLQLTAVFAHGCVPFASLNCSFFGMESTTFVSSLTVRPAAIPCESQECCQLLMLRFRPSTIAAAFRYNGRDCCWPAPSRPGCCRGNIPCSNPAGRCSGTFWSCPLICHIRSCAQILQTRPAIARMKRRESWRCVGGC